MCKKLGVLLVVLSAVSLVAAQAKLDGPFQVRYFSNLNVGDSYIDITNSGASGGNICVNVYAFSPDEQEVSCCACPVTPNGLESLSVVSDLISNTLTPATPTSVVVKLVATRGTSCNAAVPFSSSNPLANGMLAWGTTLHASPAGYATTETAFSPATLSAAEETRITNFCSFIQANGSGFGICRSCRLGGLAPKQ